MSMTKLIHSGSFDETIGVGMEIIRREGDLTKRASTIFGKEYDDLKPDDRHVGIHVVALGDAEHYGQNRNGDLFSKEACIKYHPTFVKYGCVFRHHRNKDAETQGIGKIAAAVYNEPMGRIELFIHADKEKAAPELERLEKEGEIPFSMACTVPNDRCSICGALRKSAGDSSECEHVRDHLGEQWDDGRKVGTFNDEPKFFDISFVGRPADRIAWNLKVASAIELDSVKAAEYEGVEPPDDLACDTPSALRKLGYARDIVDIQDSYRGWLTKSAAVVSLRDRYLYSLRKVAASSIDDETISRMREQPLKNMFSELGSSGVLMDVPSFFKYATGDDYEIVVKPYVSSVEMALPSVLRDSVLRKRASALCNCTDYDTFDDLSRRYVPLSLHERLSKYACDVNESAVDSAIENRHVEFIVDTKPGKVLTNGVTEKLAEAYLAYELSAIDAIVKSRRGSPEQNKLELEALVSANNLQKR
jgi:hypothetical protein